MDLGASDEQLECPILFCCGRQGTASLDPDVPGTDLIPLFDTLLDYPASSGRSRCALFQMLVSLLTGATSSLAASALAASRTALPRSARK